MSLLKSCTSCKNFLYTGLESPCPTCVNLCNWTEDESFIVRDSSYYQVFSALYGPKPKLPEKIVLSEEAIKQIKESSVAISLSKSVEEELTKMAEATLGKKFDSDKVDWTLMPWKELEQVLMILEFGAKKYSRDNWKHIEPARYEKAAMRHLISYITGELNDPETGKSHLAHLVCNALFLMWNDNHRDDPESV